MSLGTFDQQIDAARRRLVDLEQRAGGSAEERAVMAEALAELSTALEELHVVAAELHQQNEELVATRQTLEAEHRRYQELFEFAPDGYLVTDPEGTIREANRAVAIQLGIRPEFLMGKPLLVFVEEAARPAFHLGLTRMRGGTKITRGWQLQLQPREGRPFPVELTVGPVLDAAGRLTGLRWLIRDITERRQAEAALQVSEEKFAKAFRSSPDAITITTLAEGRYLDVNDSFLRLTGYRRDEVIGHTSRDLGIWQDPEDRGRLVRPVEERGAVSGLELEISGRSGELIVGIVSAEVFDIGEERCLLMVFHNITDRKRLERERETLVRALQDTLAKVKTLSGLLPICASCKQIRDDDGYWTQVEAYITKHSEATFSHGICPQCADKLYAELAQSVADRPPWSDETGQEESGEPGRVQ